MSSAIQIVGLPGKRRAYLAKTPAGNVGRSSFDRTFGRFAADPFFRSMGRDVWYESKLDGPGRMTAIVGAEETRELDPATGDRPYERTRPLTVRRTAASPLVAASVPPAGTLLAVRPSAGDTVVIDNARYAVRRVMNDSADMATLELVRFETLEVSRPRYRGRQ